MHRPPAHHSATFIHAEALAGRRPEPPHESLPSLASWQRAIEREERAEREASARPEADLAEEEIAFAAMAPRDVALEATVMPPAEPAPVDWRRPRADRGPAN